MKTFNEINESGSIILVVILTLPFLVAIAIYYMSLSLTSAQVSHLDQMRTAAQLAADAGADYSVEQLSANSNWTGTGSPVTLHSDPKYKTTFTSTVSGGSSSKTIAVTGSTYWPANSSTPGRTVKIYVDLYPVVSGNYSVVAGAGGLYMSNSSKVVGGNLDINGEINMSNTAQIGLSTAPVTVSVADDVCPNPATSAYPRVCAANENGQPITMSAQNHIYGTVTATNQTNGTGMTNTGLVANGTAAVQALPTYDRASQKSAATNNMTGAAASCSNKQNVVWPANTKITGDVTAINQCTITVKGNVWITGKLSMGNTTQMKVDNSVGTTQPVIMIDGSTGLTLSNAAAVVSNTSNTGVEFITFYSTAGCSPDCTSVTGTSLATSRTISTINLGNSGSGPNTTFYAYWTQVTISNSGSIGAVIGQTINMSNTATITFGSSSGVSSTTWVIKGYRRQ